MYAKRIFFSLNFSSNQVISNNKQTNKKITTFHLKHQNVAILSNVGTDFVFFVCESHNLIVGDAASECETSYYSEYDPFDYLYSSGTQCSDPVYEAVIKIDRPPISPATNVYAGVNASIQSFDFKELGEQLDSASSFTVPDWDARDDELSDFTMIPSSATAPPLPPRNINRSSSNADAKQPSMDRFNMMNVDRLKVATKLYENVIENRTYDAELVAFYNMVSCVVFFLVILISKSN